jgi:hypothetical protein
MTATNTLNKLYNKVSIKSNKVKVVDVDEKAEKQYSASSSPFLKPSTMDLDHRGTPALPDDTTTVGKPYKTSSNIGDLPAGGGGHHAAQLPDNSSGDPFDYSAPSGDEEDEKRRKVMRTSSGDDIEIKEQDDKTPIDPTVEEEPEEGAGDMELPADPATTDPSMNAQQPGAMDMGGDMGGEMGGDMGMGEEEKKSPHELGRIYELKKIYARLTSIEGYLSSEADPELSEIRRFVSQSIELFEIVASNIDSYKDNMEEIIISYYKFLKEVYFKIKGYYKTKSEDRDDV